MWPCRLSVTKTEEGGRDGVNDGRRSFSSPPVETKSAFTDLRMSIPSFDVSSSLGVLPGPSLSLIPDVETLILLHMMPAWKMLVVEELFSSPSATFVHVTP